MIIRINNALFLLSFCFFISFSKGEVILENKLYQLTGEFHPQSELPTARMVLNGHLVIVEVASDNKTRTYGLMNRYILPQNQGMLFDFEDVNYRSFWMKNTKIPLDIIYIDEKGVVINIIQAEPCVMERCKSYPSERPVKYVLELGKNEAKRLGIEKGYRIESVDF